MANNLVVLSGLKKSATPPRGSTAPNVPETGKKIITAANCYAKKWPDCLCPLAAALPKIALNQFCCGVLHVRS